MYRFNSEILVGALQEIVITASRIWGASARVILDVVVHSLLGFLLLFGGLPESLLELKNLTSLQSVQSGLLSQFVVEVGNGLFQSVGFGLGFKIGFHLLVLFGLLIEFFVLLVDVSLEATNLLFFCEQKLLEAFDLGRRASADDGPVHGRLAGDTYWFDLLGDCRSFLLLLGLFGFFLLLVFFILLLLLICSLFLNLGLLGLFG